MSSFPPRNNGAILPEIRSFEGGDTQLFLLCDKTSEGSYITVREDELSTEMDTVSPEEAVIYTTWSQYAPQPRIPWYSGDPLMQGRAQRGHCPILKKGNTPHPPSVSYHRLQFPVNQLRYDFASWVIYPTVNHNIQTSQINPLINIFIIIYFVD